MSAATPQKDISLLIRRCPCQSLQVFHSAAVRAGVSCVRQAGCGAPLSPVTERLHPTEEQGYYYSEQQLWITPLRCCEILAPALHFAQKRVEIVCVSGTLGSLPCGGSDSCLQWDGGCTAPRWVLRACGARSGNALLLLTSAFLGHLHRTLRSTLVLFCESPQLSTDPHLLISVSHWGLKTKSTNKAALLVVKQSL